MVAGGRLTQERADAIEESIDSFGFGDLSAHGFMRRSGGLDMPFLGRHAWPDDLDLGVDLEELRTRLESGLSLEDALAELGVDVDSLVESARQAAEDRIDQMLADGDLPAERAEQLRRMLDGFDLSRVLPYGRDSHLMPAPFDGPHRHGGAFDRPGTCRSDSRPSPAFANVPAPPPRLGLPLPKPQSTVSPVHPPNGRVARKGRNGQTGGSGSHEGPTDQLASNSS